MKRRKYSEYVFLIIFNPVIAAGPCRVMFDTTQSLCDYRIVWLQFVWYAQHENPKNP